MIKGVIPITPFIVKTSKNADNRIIIFSPEHT